MQCTRPNSSERTVVGSTMANGLSKEAILSPNESFMNNDGNKAQGWSVLFQEGPNPANWLVWFP